MQRGTDLQFLRMLARRTGKLCRVACRRGAQARTGIFAKPSLDGDPVATLKPQRSRGRQCRCPRHRMGRHAAGQQSSRARRCSPIRRPKASPAMPRRAACAPLDERDLATFAGQPMTVHADRPGRRRRRAAPRAEAVLREAGWFVRVHRRRRRRRASTHVLRVGQIVQVDALGSVHSGKYCVWSVRHSITAEAHRDELRAGPQRRRTGWRPAAGRADLMTREQLLLDLSDRVRSRFYGKYRGTVTEVDAETLRIKAKVPGGARRPDERLVRCRACPTPARSVGIGVPARGRRGRLDRVRGRRRLLSDLGRLLLARRRTARRRQAGGQGHHHQGQDQAPARRRPTTVELSDANDNTVTLDVERRDAERQSPASSRSRSTQSRSTTAPWR